MTLRATQQAFRSYLLSEDEEVQSLVAPDAQANLGVYRNAYRRQLILALRETFERTWAWLGDERFDAAASAHVDRAPPSDWTLNRYGGDFDWTLNSIYPSDPEVGELASLEWALRRAFDGPDAGPIEQDRLASVDWENAVLTFVPTLSVLSLRTNAAAIWTAIADNRHPPAAELLTAPAVVRVWRQDLSPMFQTMDDIETLALGQARAGATFSQICERLNRLVGTEEAVGAAASILRSWLDAGLVAEIHS